MKVGYQIKFNVESMATARGPFGRAIESEAGRVQGAGKGGEGEGS